MRTREEIRQQLMKLKKEDLVKEFISVLILLDHYDNEDDSYSVGWKDSRETIIQICNLERFM